MAGKVIVEHKLCIEDQQALAEALLNEEPDVSHLLRLKQAMQEKR
jgi:hypothetical protein